MRVFRMPDSGALEFIGTTELRAPGGRFETMRGTGYGSVERHVYALGWLRDGQVEAMSVADEVVVIVDDDEDVTALPGWKPA